MQKRRVPTKYFILSGVSAASVLLDQWTKFLITSNFYYGESVEIIESFFNLVYVKNTGAAFSLLHDAPAALREPFLLAVPVIALAIILAIFIKLKQDQRWVAYALSLICGGAIGNLIDRYRFGYVIDFLDFHWKDYYHWPAFNVADSCIVVGVGMMFIDSFLLAKKQAG